MSIHLPKSPDEREQSVPGALGVRRVAIEFALNTALFDAHTVTVADIDTAEVVDPHTRRPGRNDVITADDHTPKRHCCAERPDVVEIAVALEVDCVYTLQAAWLPSPTPPTKRLRERNTDASLTSTSTRCRWGYQPSVDGVSPPVAHATVETIERMI